MISLYDLIDIGSYVLVDNTPYMIITIDSDGVLLSNDQYYFFDSLDFSMNNQQLFVK